MNDYVATEVGWNESLRALDERRDSAGNFILSEAWFEPEEVHPWRAEQVESNRIRREEESAGYEGFEESFSAQIIDHRVPDKRAEQKAAREEKWKFKLERRAEAVRLRELQQNHDESKLQHRLPSATPTFATPAIAPLTSLSTLLAHQASAMDIDPPIVASTSNPQSNLPFHPVPPPLLPSPISTPANVTTRNSTIPEKRRRLDSKVDLTLDSDDDDDVLIVSEAGIAPLSGSTRLHPSFAAIKQPPEQTKEAPVVRVSTETRGRRSTGKRDYSLSGMGTVPKKPKRPPTLLELIAARKKTKIGEKISFNTVEEYETYLKPAAVSPNLVFSSCRIILLNYTPPLNSSLHPCVMKWVDLVATKGGTLVASKDFVAPPSSAEVELDWTRASGRDADRDASLLQQAKDERWTSHIVIIEPEFPSSANPPAPTLNSVLESVGLDSLTKDSLGRYVKIVRTGWLSGSGAEVVPCSEVGHEMFVNERRTEMVNEADERATKSRRKAKEKSVALDREREARDTSDEGSGNEAAMSDYDGRDHPGDEGLLPLYTVTTSIPSTIHPTTDDVYNEHNYPHVVNFKDIEEELRAVEELQSAEEDNDSTRSSDSDQFDEASGIQTQKQPSRKLKKLKSSRNPKEPGMGSGKFQCELASLQGSKKNGPNEHIAKVFDELGKFNEEDPWRSMAYRKASGALRRCKWPIKTVDDAKGIFGIGDRSRQRLDIILKTGTHPRLTMDVGRQESIKLFTSIYGVGTRTASKWYDVLELRTIKDVRAKINLNAGQLLGLQYFLDLQRRIPRPEVSELFSHVQRAAAQVHPGLHVECMGSYRRGQPDCGDIDILVTLDHRKYKQDHTGMITKLLRYLADADVVQHELSVSDDPGAIDMTFHGLCSLPGGKHPMRRMDILGVPFDDLPAALIYFTGNDIFNRSLRLKARKMGYSLNQIALTKNVTRHKAGGPLSNQKSNEGQRVPGIKTEADIFRVLGVTMRPPHERQP